MVDPAERRSVGGNGGRVVAVVHVARVGHVAEAVPVGPGLEAHGDVVVAGVEGVGISLRVQGLVDGVHGVGRVVAARDEAGLHSFLLERDAQRDGPSVAHTGSGAGDHLGGDEVEGADLVVIAPASPVADTGGQCLKLVGHRHGGSSLSEVRVSSRLQRRLRRREAGQPTIVRGCQRRRHAGGRSHRGRTMTRGG